MTVSDQITANSEPLTPKQEQLIAVLVSGVNIAAAAKAIGIGDKTARRWLKLPHFMLAYRKAQGDLFTDALQGLQGKIGKAISTLDRNMSSEETPASTQVRAAQIVLEQAIAIHKVSELEQKISELEQIINDRLTSKVG